MTCEGERRRTASRPSMRAMNASTDETGLAPIAAAAGRARDAASAPRRNPRRSTWWCPDDVVDDCVEQHLVGDTGATGLRRVPARPRGPNARVVSGRDSEAVIVVIDIVVVAASYTRLCAPDRRVTTTQRQRTSVSTTGAIIGRRLGTSRK